MKQDAPKTMCRVVLLLFVLCFVNVALLASPECRVRIVEASNHYLEMRLVNSGPEPFVLSQDWLALGSLCPLKIRLIDIPYLELVVPISESLSFHIPPIEIVVPSGSEFVWAYSLKSEFAGKRRKISQILWGVAFQPNEIESVHIAGLDHSGGANTVESNEEVAILALRIDTLQRLAPDSALLHHLKSLMVGQRMDQRGSL